MRRTWPRRSATASTARARRSQAVPPGASSTPSSPQRRSSQRRREHRTCAVSVIGVREAVSDDVSRLASWNAQLIADEGNDAPMAVDELVMRMREWLASEYRACVFDADGT